MQLYATPLSSFSLKVRLAAAWKGMDLEMLAPPGGYRSAEYRAVVPTGTIPALMLDDGVLTESDAIIEYLEEAFPGPSLLPAAPVSRARSRMLSRLHDFRIDPPLRAMFAEAKAMSPDPARVAPDLERFRHGLVLVETMRPPARFIAGDSFTLADCAYVGSLIIARRMLPRLGMENPLPDWATQWLDRIAAEPALASLLAGYESAVSDWLG